MAPLPPPPSAAPRPPPPPPPSPPSPPPRVVGCLDPAAYNYNPTATVASEAACAYVGCLVPVALSFDSVATLQLQPPDLCRYAVLGCTQPGLLGYHSGATEDDGSCAVAVAGCAHEGALNFDSRANAADASCSYAGCTDPAADSYLASASVDDGSCVSLPRGCMAPSAANFDAAAKVDDGSCAYAVPGCSDPAALNWFPLATAALGCRYAGCTVPAAPNYNPSAVVSDGSCTPALRAGGTVATFSYMTSCFTFVAADDGSLGSTAWGTTDTYTYTYTYTDTVTDTDTDTSTPNGTTDATGRYALRYHPSQRGLVQAMPSGTSGQCTDVLLGSPMQVPLLTMTTAALATQLTTLAALLVRDAGMGEGAASATLVAALGLPSQDVWRFDAFAAAYFGSPPMQGADMLWLMRQLQVQVSVGCMVRALDPGAAVDPAVDPAADLAAARAAFGTLAAMLQAAATAGSVVDLADVAVVLELAAGTAAALGRDPAVAVAAAAECAATNRELGGAAAASAAAEAARRRRRRRRLSEEGGATAAAPCGVVASGTEPRAQCGAAQCALTATLAAVRMPVSLGGDLLFPNSSSPCVDGELPAVDGCMLPSALNFDPDARLPRNAACRIGGCTDAEARNYDPRATQDDGSCARDVGGCMDRSALDYSSLATSLTGCTYAVPGCTDSRASNFLAAATVAVAAPAEAGGCALMGCTDPAATALYAAWALHDDGSCALGGCLDPAALNHMAGATHDDGSCGVLGCTDAYAPNHDAAATLDDGSCVTVIRGCVSPEADNYNPSAVAPRGTPPYAAYAGTSPFAADGCLYVGCTQPDAANYDSRASYDSGWCVGAPPGAPPPPRATSDGTIGRATLLSSAPEGGFNFTLSAHELFGYAVAGVGDVDGDGTPDLAVGAPGYGGHMRGAVYIVFIDPVTGGAKGGSRLHDELPLSAYDHFGAGLAGVGDVDGDGVPDLAVGAWGDDGDGSRGRVDAGAVYILFLQRDGSARPGPYRKLGSPAGSEGGEFGGALALLSTDGEGSVELAVGSPGGGAAGGGQVHICSLSPGGTLASTRQLAPAGLGRPGDRFGASLSALDGVGAGGAAALAVGAPGPSSGDEGALLDLSSDVDGAVHVIDLSTYGGSLLATLASPSPTRGALFGRSVAGAADYDGNGVADLVVGAPASAGGGALYVLFLGRNASDGGALGATAHRRIGAATLGLAADAGLGRSAARLGMVDADLVEDLAVGLNYDVPLGGLGVLANAGGALVLLMTAHTYPQPPPAAPPAPPLSPPPPLDSWESQLLAAHNSRRADHCAPDLAWDAALAESAMAHARRCPAADEPSAAAARGAVGESRAVGAYHATAGGVAAAWYSEVAYYAQYGEEPAAWRPAGRVDRWGRFAQMVWVGSSRLGCGYTANCTSGVPRWVCHYEAPGLREGEFVLNVRPSNGPGCVLSPSPPSPPPPIASPPPNFPPFGTGQLSDTASSIANPDEQGGNTKMTSAAVAAIVLCGLLLLGLCYYMLGRRKSAYEIATMNLQLARATARYLARVPEVLHGTFWQPSLLLGLAPETRLEFNWSGLRAGARSEAPPHEQRSFDSLLPLEPGGVLPPAWTSGDEGGGEGIAGAPRRPPVGYATNYSADTTWE